MIISLLLSACQHQILMVVSVFVQHIAISFTGNVVCVRSDRFCSGHDTSVRHAPLLEQPTVEPTWCHSTVSFLISVCLSFQSSWIMETQRLLLRCVISLSYAYSFSSPICQPVQLGGYSKGNWQLIPVVEANDSGTSVCFPACCPHRFFYYSWQKYWGLLLQTLKIKGPSFLEVWE